MFVISIVVRLHFARVFSSNSASASFEYSKIEFSSCFVDENSPATDGDLTRVFSCILTIRTIF